MARKTQISKEVILEAAFQILLRKGYGAINITGLAKEIGCSTQPIAWQFGSMEGLRAELLEYCLNFLKDRFVVEGDNISGILEGIAFRYIELAVDYPNLYKYLYMSEQDGKKMAETARALRVGNQEKVVRMLQEKHGVSAEGAAKYLLNLQLYVHGIASFVVTKVEFPSKELIMQMIHDASEAFIKQTKERQQDEDY